MSEELAPLEEVSAPEAVKTTNETVPSDGAAESQETTAHLSQEERSLLQETEKVIETGLGQFSEVGKALSQINDSRLYREKFNTFDEYCKVRWDLGASYAYRLIESAKCMAVLKEQAETEGYSVLPANESQVRELVRLKKSDRRVAAWKRAVKAAEDNPLTAEVVEEVVNEMLGSTSKKGSAKSTKGDAERQLKSIAKLVTKELEKSKDLKPKLKSLLKKILGLTGVSVKPSK